MLIPIVSLFLGLILLLIFAWVSYPFILKFRIDNSIGTNVNLINGSNGNNGVNGSNSKNPILGVPGSHGTNGISGRNGTNGISGSSGQKGHSGIEGKAGDPGSVGNRGVLGYQCVQVKQDIFNNLVPYSFYVNGENIDDHVDTVLANIKSTSFENEKSRLVSRTNSTFSNDVVSKNFFLNIIENVITPALNDANPGPAPVLTPYILNSQLRYSNFLDAYNANLNTQIDSKSSVINAQNVIIANSQATLNNLRNFRTQDFAKLTDTIFVLGVRNELINVITPPATQSLLSYIPELANFDTNISITIDSVIKNISSQLSTAISEFNSIDSTASSANRTLAINKKSEIDVLQDKQTKLQNLKKHIDIIIQQKKADIQNDYNNGGIPTTVYTVTFNDYTPGATSVKNNIDTANTAIISANNVFNTNIDSFVTNYKNANP